jgi:hypothetical protein
VPPRKHSENSDVSRTEVERPTLDGGLDEETKKRLEASAKLENPLRGLSPDELAHRGEEFCQKHGITDAEDIRAFRLGAMIAGNMNKFDSITDLTEEERGTLGREVTNPWQNPRMLYAVIIICSLCAAVQGMDETVVNGAQFFYKKQFEIGSEESRGM